MIAFVEEKDIKTLIVRVEETSYGVGEDTYFQSVSENEEGSGGTGSRWHLTLINVFRKDHRAMMRTPLNTQMFILFLHNVVH